LNAGFPHLGEDLAVLPPVRTLSQERQHISGAAAPLVALADWSAMETQGHQCVDVGGPQLLQTDIAETVGYHAQ
jgi:hypothetical protein